MVLLRFRYGESSPVSPADVGTATSCGTEGKDEREPAPEFLRRSICGPTVRLGDSGVRANGAVDTRADRVAVGEPVAAFLARFRLEVFLGSGLGSGQRSL